MCGITGLFTFSESEHKRLALLPKALLPLSKRGPDNQSGVQLGSVALGHTRLAIIDTSVGANQPFSDTSGRYTLVFNGEIFNFKELRQKLITQGVLFYTESDTEVLLHHFIRYGSEGLQELNGFFAFALYDKQTQELVIARDRYGIKPLYYYRSENYLAFASELTSLMAWDIPKHLNQEALHTYLQLNYIPAPLSILQHVYKLSPGKYLSIKPNHVSEHTYYTLPQHSKQSITPTYTEAQKILHAKLEQAVQARLVADVPIGCFLSGGIDSSIITALAAKHVSKLHTFSIGFSHAPLFDETRFALAVAQKHGTEHTVFDISNQQLFEQLHDVLHYLDEPFGDSSSLPLYILSKLVRKQVTVALSGDGADELFGGYNKHAGELNVRHYQASLGWLKHTQRIWQALPASRNSKAGNVIRQLRKFSKGFELSAAERYWQWAGYRTEEEALQTLIQQPDLKSYSHFKNSFINDITPDGNLNQVLQVDMRLVLQGDMLNKVDRMSMANSLEVRVPFLDFNVVDFASQLPADYKVSKAGRKRILKDAFKHELPELLHHRNKQGFEVPLLDWFRGELKSLICDDLLSDNYIQEQNIFQPSAIQALKQQLFSNNPGDAVARIWGLMAFQVWYKKHME